MIKPLINRVLIRRYVEEEKISPGGIYLPNGDTPDKSNMVKGVVLAVGPGVPGVSDKPAADVKPGDVVVFNKYAADFFRLYGYDVITVSSLDIWANVSGAKDIDMSIAATELAKFNELANTQHAAAGTPQQNDADSGGA